MRQTRRSRSAATPQKDDAPPQTEEVKDSVKANLETVFEKEGDAKDEVGSAVESSTPDTSGGTEPAVPSESEVSLQDETKLLEETVSNSGDIQSEGVGSNPSGDPTSPSKIEASSPVKTAASPKVTQSPVKNSEVIELNCKVCNCSFTNYQEHMNSEAHKSKISHSNPKTDGSNDKTPVANQAQKRAGDQALDSTPSKRMKNQNQAAQNASDKFRCDVCNASMAKQQDYDLHMNGKRHLLNVTRAQGKAYCDICKLFFNTVTDLNDHTDSQLHKTNVANRKTDKEPFDCKVCNITIQGKRQYEQHLSSKRHKKTLSNPTAATKKVAVTPAPATANNTTTTAASTAASVNGKPETNIAESQKKWLYTCNACNFGCNQDQQFSSHMNLADHKAAVTDMKKKGLVKDQGPSKPAPAKAPVTKPAPVNNAPQNVRKFPHNNAATGPRNFGGPQGMGNRPQNFVNKPGPNQGPITKVTYNVVPGNMNAGGPTGVPPKQGPMKKDGPQANRKGPLGGPGGPSTQVAPAGPKKPMPLNKPNMPVNKPPMTGRPNPRFGGQGENQQNKFAANAQPLKLGFQKPFGPDGPGNFGSHAFANVGDVNNAGGNFGNFGQRQAGNFGNMRNDNINQSADVRGDFRGNMRDDFRTDIRDLRDIRNLDMGMDNRGDSNYRSGYYRDMPADSARDNRNDYSNFRGGDMSMDSRSDMRSGLAADTRGDMRGLTRNDMGGDIRSYNSDMRDLRTDSRNDFMRDRNTNYGGASSFGQQNYRGNDDYRSDNYSRGSQLSSQAASTGGYPSGMMSSGRYDSSFMDRNSSAYNSQYAGQSRGMGYMGDMTLNGR